MFRINLKVPSNILRDRFRVGHWRQPLEKLCGESAATARWGVERVFWNNCPCHEDDVQCCTCPSAGCAMRVLRLDSDRQPSTATAHAWRPAKTALQQL
eukprot:g7770.t1